MSMVEKPGQRVVLHAVDFVGEQTLGKKQCIGEDDFIDKRR